MTTANLTLEQLYQAVSERLKTQEYDRKYPANAMDILKNKEQTLKLEATDGSPRAREYLKNRIFFILGSMKKEINRENVDATISLYHVDYYKNIFSGGNPKFIKTQVDKDIEKYFERYSINLDDAFDIKLSKLSQIIYQELFGFSVIDELVFDGSFNEVATNRFDYVWVQYKGIKRRIPNPYFKFISEDFYNKVVENRLTTTAREEMNAGEPFINCTLKNGYRVTAVRPPLSKYHAASIRCFSDNALIKETHTKLMENKMLKLVEVFAKKGRRNIAIIGEQGSGKTTAADDIIIRSLDDSLSIGLAEYTHELAVSEKYPEKNVVELQYGKQFEPSNITEMFFRFNRDIIVYGEVRNPFEAFEMIKAMLRQSRGSLFTFHSSSVQRMIHDLRQLLMQTGYYSDYKEAKYDAADAIDLVIHIKLDRETGKRYVFKISEIIANAQDMTYSIRDLFIYSKELNKYLVEQDGPSNSMLTSCMEYEMTVDDVSKIISLFTISPDEKNLFEYKPEESRCE